jgi:hypothetical protein
MYVKQRKEINIMTVTVYVNWEERRILKKEEFMEEINTLVENINENHYERGERLEAFLNYKRLDCVDLFDMSETDKQELVKEFEEWLVMDAEVELLEDVFDEVEIEL